MHLLHMQHVSYVLCQVQALLRAAAEPHCTHNHASVCAIARYSQSPVALSVSICYPDMQQLLHASPCAQHSSYSIPCSPGCDSRHNISIQLVYSHEQLYYTILAQT